MTPQEPLGVDAVVVTWNSAPDLASCLGALPPGVRAIVVDNASVDGSVAAARSAGAEVTALGRNEGFPTAVNIGLQQVTAPATLLLNPDVVLDPGALERCVEVLWSDPGIGAVGPNTRDAEGRPERAAARRDRTALQVLVESLGLVHLSPALDLQAIRDRGSDCDVDAVNGAAVLVRTDLLRRIGGLDEDVFLYLEDQVLCRAIRDAGHRVRFVAGAGAVHLGGSSTGRGDPSAQARAYLHRIDADVEFLRRYGRPGEPIAAALAFALRSLIGLAASVVLRDRRARYRAALGYSLRQVRGRVPAPPV
jgi:GT2 family glycosyltransferase